MYFVYMCTQGYVFLSSYFCSLTSPSVCLVDGCFPVLLLLLLLLVVVLLRIVSARPTTAAPAPDAAGGCLYTCIVFPSLTDGEKKNAACPYYRSMSAFSIAKLAHDFARPKVGLAGGGDGTLVGLAGTPYCCVCCPPPPGEMRSFGLWVL